jgi:ferredoxin-NADP reductase
MPTQNLIPLQIQKIIRETDDTHTFQLKNLSGKEINYVAGQFLSFVFEKRNGEEERRNYSISSAAVLEEPLSITVKRIPNGEFSRQLTDYAKEGDTLFTIGASGFFTLPSPEDMPAQFFFFAAGSGITPVFSLIKTLLFTYPETKIVLVYSNPSPSKTIFYQSLLDLKSRYNDRLHVEFLFSNATAIHHKRLGIYLLENLLDKYISGTIQQTLFYLCGPFEYMRMITIVLRNQGVPKPNIRKEIFIIDKPVQKELPSDTETHNITALLDGNEYVFAAQYPDTILQSAKKLHITLPYSCESGQCGTCAATCISGKVWMWRNDVLLDEEMAKGKVLTCTGYAVGGDVVLKY